MEVLLPFQGCTLINLEVKPNAEETDRKSTTYLIKVERNEGILSSFHRNHGVEEAI